MAKGTHWIIFITKEYQNMPQKYSINNQGKNKENDSGRNRTGVHLVLAVPQSLTPQRVLTTWGKKSVHFNFETPKIIKVNKQ